MLLRSEGVLKKEKPGFSGFNRQEARITHRRCNKLIAEEWMKTFRFGTICILSVASRVLAQDASNLSRSERSLLQPEMQIELAAGGFDKSDHAAGDLGGYREHVFNSVME